MEGPNYQLQIIRIRHEIMQQETALFRQTLDIMEALDRIEKAKENRTAHERAIAEAKKRLTDLEATHGQFTGADVDKAADAARDA